MFYDTIIIIFIVHWHEDSTTVSTSLSNTTINPEPNTFEELTTTSTSTIITNEQSMSQRTVIAITTGVVSAIITALLVGGICLIGVYQCLYKPRLRSSTSIAVGGHDESHRQKEGVTGSGDAIVYDVVNERPGVAAALEMKENEAYSINKRVEMRENEAYGVNKRVNGPEMKENEAYGIIRST